MTAQNVSRLMSPLGVRAQVAGACHPGGYMCRVPGSTDPPSSAHGILLSARWPFRPPGIAVIEKYSICMESGQDTMIRIKECIGFCNLFPKMKIKLKGRRFYTIEEI